LDDFKSLWTIGGLQPLCRYSKPASLIMLVNPTKFAEQK